MENNSLLNFLSGILENMEECKYEYSKIFYEKIFSDHPNLKSLFREDDTVLALTLVENIEVFQACSNNFTSMKAKLKRMGLKHKSYRVKPVHYPIVKQAFVFLFQTIACDKFNKELETQFTQLYDRVAETMILGSRRK